MYHVRTFPGFSCRSYNRNTPIEYIASHPNRLLYVYGVLTRTKNVFMTFFFLPYPSHGLKLLQIRQSAGTGVTHAVSRQCCSAPDMEDLDASITIVHWNMFHKPLSDAEGGCKHGNLTWGQRKRNYDYITWEGAQVEAHEAVVAHNETSPEETANDAGDLVGAAGTFAYRYNDANKESYADVDMYLSDSG
jgi:hypothetical protein